MGNNGAKPSPLLLQLGNVAAVALTLVGNILVNTLPLNGVTTAQVSDSYPNLFTPPGYVFAIWGVIYALAIIFALYQLRPSQRIERAIEPRRTRAPNGMVAKKAITNQPTLSTRERVSMSGHTCIRSRITSAREPTNSRAAPTMTSTARRRSSVTRVCRMARVARTPATGAQTRVPSPAGRSPTSAHASQRRDRRRIGLSVRSVVEAKRFLGTARSWPLAARTRYRWSSSAT